MTIEFFITSLIVVLLPGTGVIFTISTGLGCGAKAGIFAAAGCTVGIIPHLCASILGVAAILHSSAVAFQLFKFAGVLYLAWLAWAMWQESGSIEFGSAREMSWYRIMIRGFLINILNPKLSIFFLAFLPQFMADHSNKAMPQLLLLSGVFMAMTFAVFVIYGLLADRVRHVVVNSPLVIQYTQRLFAGMFVLFSARLAFAER